MKIIRFYYKRDNKTGYGLLRDDKVEPIKGSPYESKIVYAGGTLDLKDIKILAPSTPSKIVLVGLNYRNHAKELRMSISDEPVIFLKPPTTVIGHKDTIIIPENAGRIDYEAELAVVIGKTCRKIKESETDPFIFGYTCLNDVTARDLQNKDVQWIRAKSFDTFCPIGPLIETEPQSRLFQIKLYLNGEVKQSQDTSDLIFPIKKLVSFVSEIMTLYPGDIISTGTPSGVGKLTPGDLVQINVDQVGSLENTVA